MYKKAFTMAEMILAFIIIGILAIILMQNISNKTFNNKELSTLGNKAIETIDHAIVKMLAIESNTFPTGSFISNIVGTNTSEFSAYNGASKASEEDIMNLFNNYIKLESRGINFCDNTDAPFCNNATIAGAKMTDGVFFGIQKNAGDNINDCIEYRMPGVEEVIAPPTSYNERTKTFETEKCWGTLYIDVNGIEGPNVYGQDIYQFGLANKNIAR